MSQWQTTPVSQECTDRAISAVPVLILPFGGITKGGGWKRVESCRTIVAQDCDASPLRSTQDSTFHRWKLQLEISFHLRWTSIQSHTQITCDRKTFRDLDKIHGKTFSKQHNVSKLIAYPLTRCFNLIILIILIAIHFNYSNYFNLITNCQQMTANWRLIADYDLITS